MKKRILSVVMAAVLMVGISGCSSNGTTETTDVQALLETAQTKMAEVESLSATMSLHTSLTSGEESIDVGLTGTSDIIKEPLQLKTDMTMNMNELSAPYQMYLLQTETGIDSYLSMGEQWQYQEIPAESIGVYDTSHGIDVCLTNLSDAQIIGTETIENAETSIVTGTITGDAMKEMLETSNIQNVAATLSMSAEDIVSLVGESQGIPVTVWIAEDGTVMQYEQDLTALIATVFDTLAQQAEEENTLVIGESIVQTTYSNFNGITEIEVPQEALDTKTTAE